jgi:hypothetical protein
MRGDGWSVSLDDGRGVWWDHRDSVGGGVLSLIQHARGGTRLDAVRWLAEWRGVALDGDSTLSPQERRRYAQARQHAAQLARVAGLWWRERREEMERTKANALERLILTTADLEAKLINFQHDYNGHRTHAGLEGGLPEPPAGGDVTPTGLGLYRWRRHCRAPCTPGKFRFLGLK